MKSKAAFLDITTWAGQCLDATHHYATLTFNGETVELQYTMDEKDVEFEKLIGIE